MTNLSSPSATVLNIAHPPPRAPGARHQRLVEAARAHGAVVTAVVHPCDALPPGGSPAAREAGLIRPVLVGPRECIRSVAEVPGASLDEVDINDAEHSHASADRAVALTREGSVQALMKGALHTDEMMGAVVDKADGLRTDWQITHVFVLDVLNTARPMFITDAAIHIEPDLAAKRVIIQNAIDLAHALGIEASKVAVLSAMETVTPDIASTVDAAGLCKMVERGQIVGGVVDGSLAFDNAVSVEVARMKVIGSAVVRQADILVAPALVSGNTIAKQLVYLAGVQSAGLALGARIASAALACLFVAHTTADKKGNMA